MARLAHRVAWVVVLVGAIGVAPLAWAGEPAADVPPAAVPVPGVVRGLVLDESGVEVVGARVTLSTPAGPGEDRVTESDGEGAYRFGELPPGRYVLTVEHPAFQRARLRRLEVVAGRTMLAQVELASEGGALPTAPVGRWIDSVPEPPPGIVVGVEAPQPAPSDPEAPAEPGPVDEGAD